MKRGLIFLTVLFLLSSSAWSADASELIRPKPTVSDQNENVPKAGAMTVTNPKSGAKWKTGKTYPIRWVKGSLGGKVRIYLYRSLNNGPGKYYKTLVDTANDGHYAWKIPNSIPSNPHYLIVVQSWKNDDIYDFSPYFSITKSSSGGGGYKICKTGSKKIKWSSKKMYYYVNTKGGPSGALGAIKRGASVWNRVKGSSFKFIYRGRTASRNFGKNDGKNIVAFGVLDSGFVGMNKYWYWTSSGAMIDSDIRFSTRYRWSTKKAKTAYDLQSVAAHEFGHSLCLKDLYGAADKEKTMYGIFRKGETHPRTLHPADKRGIQALY